MLDVKYYRGRLGMYWEDPEEAVSAKAQDLDSLRLLTAPATLLTSLSVST